MHFGASRFFLYRNGAYTQAAVKGLMEPTHCFRLTILSQIAIGMTLAALRYMKTKLNLVFAFAFGLLALLALPTSDATEAIVSAVAWVGDLHIAEFAAAANAFTIVP